MSEAVGILNRDFLEVLKEYNQVQARVNGWHCVGGILTVSSLIGLEGQDKIPSFFFVFFNKSNNQNQALLQKHSFFLFYKHKLS